MASCGRLADWLRTGCKAQKTLCDPHALIVVSYPSLALAPCPPGGAVITEAFDLAPVRWVIHTVGPIYEGPQDAATLASAYTQALARADEVGATTVAFPSISTGAYGYPLAEAAAVSVQALCRAATAVQSALLVAFSHRVQELWKQALQA